MKINSIMIARIICGFFILSLSGRVTAQEKVVTQEFFINGIKVIYKPVPKEIISVRFFIDGGTANYSLEQQGIENFAFQLAVTGGTKSLDKTAYSTALEQMGTSVDAGSGNDYGQFSLLCLKPYWDKSWNLFTDAIVNPAFEEDQFNLLKEQLIAGAKQAASDPDERIVRAAMENVFKGFDYEKDPAGTEVTLNALTLENITDYYRKLIGKKNGMLVVVGNVDLDDLKSKISKSLSQLPEGKPAPVTKQIEWAQPSSLIESREIATNYIRGYMNSPRIDSKDGIPMVMAMNILYDRLWIEIRTKRGLSYAPQAYVPMGIIDNPYSVLYVSTTDPKQSIKVIVDEISKLKKEGFDESELINKKQSYLTDYLMSQETLSAQSSGLGINELKGGWEMAENFTEMVNAVTLEDINRVIDKYSDVISWTYLGDPEAIGEEDLLQPNKIPKGTKIDVNK